MALFSTLVTLTCLSAIASAQYVQFAEGIGYIGPACAVVDGNLYIHGIIVRALNSSEIAEFENYQDAISKLHKLRTSPPGDSKKPFMTQPIVPNFCYGLNDNTEVVLKGCIVRDSRVFIHGKLIRPLNSIERDAVSRLLTQRSRPQALFYQRKKREVAAEAGSTTTAAPVASTTPLVLKGVHNDVAHLLEQFLHVNSTVAKRFLPVAKMSPLFNELSKEYAARGDGKSGNEDAHLRETRTAADSVLPADDYAPPSNAFAMPSFAYAGSIEQPFQQQLPQLTPLPTFNHGSQNQEADPFAGHNFNSYPQNQQNEYGNVNTFPAPTPIVSNSAYLVGGEEPVEVRGAIRQGEKYTIGGKNYVAVSMNELTPSQLAQIGQLYGNIQPGVGIGNNNNGMNNNNNQGYGSFVGQPQFPNTQTWQPYNPYQQAAAVPEPMSPFGQNFASQPMHKIRYHPGKEATIVAPSLSQEALNAGMSVINQMPHHICSAHLSNPFWFLEKK
uniref:Pepsin-I3 domain-containing protein n=1 Tax=Panagrellus redivivus TaxID=6233 RepID=A0A7E4VDL4_PANRE